MAGAVVLALTIPTGVGFAAAAPPDQPDFDGAVKVDLGTTKRDCDFNPLSGLGIVSTTTATAAARHSEGGGFAIIDSAGSKVYAEIHLTSAAPTVTYTAMLIELPSATCSPRAPGVAVATFDTDPAGNGLVNLETDVVPGATGAWVAILDGSGQVFTSNTIAPIGAGS